MSPKEMFEYLGAELNNPRWSWGSVRESDGTVFLRVWQDGTYKIDGKRYIWVSAESPPAGDLGASERFKHLGLIRSGSPCYLVMCQAVDIEAIPRKVQRFNEKELFVGGEVTLNNGAYLIELKGRIPVEKTLL